MSFSGRFVKVASFYSAYVDQTLEGLNRPSSAELEKALFEGHFSWSNHHTKHLRKMGVDATDLIFAVPLYSKIRSEELGHAEWTPFQLLLHQLRELQPEVLYLQDIYAFDHHELQQIREVLRPRLRLLIGWCCAPYGAGEVEKLKQYDLVLTCTPGFLKQFEQSGINAALLNHGFEPDLARTWASPQFMDRRHQFSFLGALGGSGAMHEERLKLIQGLLEAHIDMDLYIPRPPWNWKNQVKWALGAVGQTLSIESSQKIQNYRRFYQDQKVLSKLANRIHEPLYGLPYLQVLGQSKLTFNSHGGVAGAFAGNIRLFEATGMGACLVTDAKANLSDLFEPDVEVVTYASMQECLDKVLDLQRNPKRAEEIAKRGQERCFREHSYEVRCHQLLGLVAKALAKI